MICQGCNKKIRWWRRRVQSMRYGWLHRGCYGLAREKDVNN